MENNKITKRSIAIPAFVSLVSGIIFGIFVIVPIMKNICHPWFSSGCQEVLYQIGPSGSLLVSDPLTGFLYWYDGQFIYSYGNNLPGSCPDKLVDSTGEVVTHSSVKNPCLTWRFNEETQKNECILPPNWSTNTNNSTSYSYTPKSFQGTRVASGNVFRPVFAVDATTMQLIPEKTICALDLPFVKQKFQSSKEYRFAYRLNKGSEALDIYQLFALLRKHKIFTNPTGTPWYEKSSFNKKS